MVRMSPQSVATMFAVTAPVGTPVPVRERGQVLAWQVPTGAGPILLKRFWAEDELSWRDELELAMDLEQQAVSAGIDMPAPIPAREPVFGTVARIAGLGLFRAFPFIDHRALSDVDDVADWLGETMARTHGLRRLDTVPEPNWWYCQQPPVPADRWPEWLREGEQKGAAWASALREHLDLILEAAGRIVGTFARTGPHVISHRDVEPWNVLIRAEDGRPMLIDWDTAGPESAPLEAAYAFIAFARRGRDEPDQQQIRRAHDAYVAAGGEPLTGRPGILDRIVGQQLSIIASDIGGFFDVANSEERIRERIESLPSVVANADRWERMFGS